MPPHESATYPGMLSTDSARPAAVPQMTDRIGMAFVNLESRMPYMRGEYPREVHGTDGGGEA